MRRLDVHPHRAGGREGARQPRRRAHDRPAAAVVPRGGQAEPGRAGRVHRHEQEHGRAHRERRAGHDRGRARGRRPGARLLDRDAGHAGDHARAGVQRQREAGGMKDFGYVCDLCGRRGSDVMPTSDDDSGFSLYDQPALCRDCAKTWGSRRGSTAPSGGVTTASRTAKRCRREQAHNEGGGFGRPPRPPGAHRGAPRSPRRPVRGPAQAGDRPRARQHRRAGRPSRAGRGLMTGPLRTETVRPTAAPCAASCGSTPTAAPSSASTTSSTASSASGSSSPTTATSSPR